MSSQPSPSVSTVSRREFVKGSSLLAAAAILEGGARLGAEDKPASESTPPIPRQVLGRTGVEVSILGLGTALLGHQNNNQPEVAKLIAVFSEAVDRGINYLDTARIYGGAEEALKAVLKTRRDKVFLVTKVWGDSAQEAEKSFHESLAKLGVESVDLLHLHSTGNRDVDKVLGPAGAWEFFEKARKAGKARFLGITGHSRPLQFVKILETGKVDVLMCAMNFVDRFIYGFEEKVLPVAIKHKTGVMAMKVYGGVTGGFQNYGAPKPFPAQLAAEHHVRSIAYVKALPGVTGMVIGAHTAEQLRENIRRVVETKPLNKDELALALEDGKKIAAGWEARFGPVA